MRKIALLACAVAFGFSYSTATVRADDKSTDTTLVQENKLPKVKDLKVVDGTDAGHKTPLEVVAKAIKAAKDKKLADLKVCLSDDARRNADDKSYGLGANDATNLQHIGKVLATFSDEGQTLLKQGSVGHYAVVMCTSPMGTHFVRTIRQSIELEAKEGEEAKKGPENWYLANYSAGDYEINYNSGNVKQIVEAITKGDVAKLKEFLDPWETQGLDLLAGVKEGVDPYDLLAQRLKTIVTNGDGKPTLLLQRYGSQVAFWFSGEKADTFIVLTFWNEYEDWETKKLTTTARIAFGNTAQFHKNASDTFKSWVEDYDYSGWK
jgi:hypothetical protein